MLFILEVGLNVIIGCFEVILLIMDGEIVSLFLLLKELCCLILGVVFGVLWVFLMWFCFDLDFGVILVVFKNVVMGEVMLSLLCGFELLVFKMVLGFGCCGSGVVMFVGFWC